MSEPLFFETIKIKDGEVCDVEWHQRRYERTLEHFGRKKAESLKEAIQPPKQSGIFRSKLIYTPKKIEDIIYTPYQKRSIASLKLIEADVDYSFKYLDRKGLDQLFSQRGACDDVLIVKEGFVTDTSIANIAFFDGQEWLTPKKPLLAGTSRARHIEEGKLKEVNISPDMLTSFSKMALLNAMIDFDIIAIKEIQKDTILC